jgi:hypothetical protein
VFVWGGLSPFYPARFAHSPEGGPTVTG